MLPSHAAGGEGTGREEPAKDNTPAKTPLFTRGLSKGQNLDPGSSGTKGSTPYYVEGFFPPPPSPDTCQKWTTAVV